MGLGWFRPSDLSRVKSLPLCILLPVGARCLEGFSTHQVRVDADRTQGR
jgi:hypothetical protein